MRKIFKYLLVLIFISIILLAEDNDRGLYLKQYGNEVKTALVIGNSNYHGTNLSKLKNPINDARAVRDKLKSKGFDVLYLEDATQKDADKAIRKFSDKLKNSSVGLFFFAGHGLEVDKKNYLVPIGANVSDEMDIKYESLAVNEIVDRMKRSSTRLNLVILDACRNNPFKRGTGGLASMENAKGTLIAYATDSGSTAADNPKDKNGLFTKYFLKVLDEPINQRELFHKIRMNVYKASGERQLPYLNDGTIGTFYFTVPKEKLLSVKKSSFSFKSIKSEYSLTIKTKPENAKVSLINSDLTYYNGIKLRPGKYEIEVSLDGYYTNIGEINLQNDLTIDVKLENKSQEEIKNERFEALKKLTIVLGIIEKNYVNELNLAKICLITVNSLLKQYRTNVPKEVFEFLSSEKQKLLNLTNDETRRFEILSSLTKVIGAIEKYSKTDENLTNIVDKALKGLMQELDAHSTYMDKKYFKEMQIQTDGEFGDLGITVGMRDGALTVISPIDGTPAYEAGVESGDIILKIDEKSTLNMTLDEAVGLMRGKPGTPIVLTIVRKSENKPFPITITRDIIKIQSVYSKTIGDDVLYLRITSFDKNVTESLVAAIKENKARKGIVLDLRNNPGGLLTQAISVTDLFVDKGVIVSQKGRDAQNEEEFNANYSKTISRVPLVVLVNGGSASASEIVSGALQDHKRAVVVGQKTFGKGSVQVVFPITSDKSEGIKLTIAKYYLPSGRTIQGTGITPDILIETSNKDMQLEIAIKTLKNVLY